MNNYTVCNIPYVFAKYLVLSKNSIEKLLDYYSPAFSQSERKFIKMQLDLISIKLTKNDGYTFTCSVKDLRAFALATALLSVRDDTWTTTDAMLFFEKSLNKNTIKEFSQLNGGNHENS